MVDDSRSEQDDIGANSGYKRNSELQARFETLKTQFDAILLEPPPERLRTLVERIRAATAHREGDEL